MIYREIALPEPLRRIFLCAWQFIVEPFDPQTFQHQVPPDGTTGLVMARFADGQLHARLVGPTLVARPVPVVPGCGFAGLRLRPEMARAVTGTDPQPGSIEGSPLDGRFAPVWRDLAALMDGTCDWAETIKCLANLDLGDAVVAAAVDRILGSGGAVPVARLAALSGLSERQLRRRFHAATGIAPKQYADVLRARHALILALDDSDWPGIAHDSGFADQPHLIRDIKDRYGAAPLRVAGYFGGMRHELLDADHVRNIQAGTARAA